MTGPSYAVERTAAYATSADFCRIFAEDMQDLYWLSFVLTGDPGKAEQCFVSGLDDCHAGNRVFMDWARSWARRTVIKNAIRLISPKSSSAAPNNRPRLGQNAAGNRTQLAQCQEISAVLDLDAFDRFAFVMSILEGFSDRDCALLLGCTQAALVAGRVRALQRLASSLPASSDNRESKLGPALVDDSSAVVEPKARPCWEIPA